MTETAKQIPPPPSPASSEGAPSWQGPSESRLRSLMKLAEIMAGSGLCPKAIRGRPADVLHIFLVAEELGLKPMYALGKIYIIEGIPTLAAELKAGMVRSSILCEEFTIVESSDKRCEIRLRRKGDPAPTSFTWTIEEAFRAGLLRQGAKPGEMIGKDNWRFYPKDMLMARCLDRSTQAMFPDVLGGLASTETMQDVVYARETEGAEAPLMTNEVAIQNRIVEVVGWIEAAETIPDLQAAVALINKEPREVKISIAVRTALSTRRAEIEAAAAKETEEVEREAKAAPAVEDDQVIREVPAPSPAVAALAPAQTEMALDFSAPARETVPVRSDDQIIRQMVSEMPAEICPGCDADLGAGMKHAYDCPEVA